MKKTLLTLISIAAFTSALYATEVDKEFADVNKTLFETSLNTKTCNSFKKIANTYKDGKKVLNIDAKEIDSGLRVKIDDAVVPGAPTVTLGILQSLCYAIPTVEISFEVYLATQGLTINSFDPNTNKLQEKLKNMGSTLAHGDLLGFITKNPELIGAFIDKVKEKRFGKNAMNIPGAKDILVDNGSWKKELTPDEEKVVDVVVTTYLKNYNANL